MLKAGKWGISGNSFREIIKLKEKLPSTEIAPKA